MEGTTESARDLCGQLRWYTGGWVVESVLYLGVLGGAPASLHYGHALGMGQIPRRRNARVLKFRQGTVLLIPRIYCSLSS